MFDKILIYTYTLHCLLQNIHENPCHFNLVELKSEMLDQPKNLAQLNKTIPMDSYFFFSSKES